MICASAKAVWIVIDVAFWSVAGSYSFWYSKHAIEVLDVKEEDKKRIGESKPSQRHERWFNFLGSLTGWWAFWILLYEQFVRRASFQATDLGLIVIAVIGMSGHLPYMIKYKTTLSK